MNEKRENGPRQALPDKENPLWALLSDEQLPGDLGSEQLSELGIIQKRELFIFFVFFFALAVLKKIIPAPSKTCICIFSARSKGSDQRFSASSKLRSFREENLLYFVFQLDLFASLNFTSSLKNWDGMATD